MKIYHSTDQHSCDQGKLEAHKNLTHAHSYLLHNFYKQGFIQKDLETFMSSNQFYHVDLLKGFPTSIYSQFLKTPNIFYGISFAWCIYWNFNSLGK